jgi:hypothetical protein
MIGNDLSDLPNSLRRGCFAGGYVLYLASTDTTGAAGWTTPRPVTCVAGGDVESPDGFFAVSRPVIAWMPNRDQWVVAVRDATDKHIYVSGPLTLGTFSPVPMTQLPVTSDEAPALAHLDSNTLVLAIHNSNPNNPNLPRTPSGYFLTTLTSTDGTTFTAGATAVVAGAPLDAGPVAPFLGNGVDGAMLAVARAQPGMVADHVQIVVFTSTNGTTWTPGAALSGISGSIGGGYFAPAVAGISTGPLFAYPDSPRSAVTNASLGGAASTIPTNSTTEVAAVYAPMPKLGN